MASSSSGFGFAGVPDLLRKRSAPVIHWQVQQPPPVPTSRPRLRLSVLTTSTKSSSDNRSMSQGSSAQSKYAYNGHSPTLPTFTPTDATPLPFVDVNKDLPCAECAERDDDVRDVDVTSPGVWNRDSDCDLDEYNWEDDGEPIRLTKAALAELYGKTAATMDANARPCTCAKRTTLDLLRCQRLHMFLEDQMTLRRELDAEALEALKEELELAKESRKAAKLKREEGSPPAVPPKDWEIQEPSPIPVPTANASRANVVLHDLVSLPKRMKFKLRIPAMFGLNPPSPLDEQLRQNQSVDALFQPKPFQYSSAMKSSCQADEDQFQYPTWPISLKIGEP